LGIKNKKLAEGDLVTAKKRHWATTHATSMIKAGSLGIITFMDEYSIAVYWFDRCIQSARRPHGSRSTLLRRVSRPKR
jgi:hypothetical protein